VKPTASIKLAKGREKKIKGFYPWVQKEEVRRPEGGKHVCLADLYSDDGDWLAIGTYNRVSRFPFRVLSLEREDIDETFFRERIRQAIDHRKGSIEDTNSQRIIFSEADRLPGLIVDQFGDHLVVQVRTAGMDMLRHLWLPALIEETGAESIMEKSEMAGRREEGLEPISQVLHGEPPAKIEVIESGFKMTALVETGLKTGFYLDQRNARRELARRVKPGDKVLDCFCYTGGFGIYAAKAGAEAVGVDIHPVALEEARATAERNDVKVDFVEANAFEYLAEGAGAKGPFDWIILDPPAIAKTQDKKNSLKWAIWKLVYAALPLLKPGGRLFVCSCSYQLSQQKLIEACRLAASDRKVRLMLEGITIQDLDHPVSTQFPESLYLKGVWLRRD
jgi:23S rRNA (cytosine1962-C5)-methyltransferase